MLHRLAYIACLATPVAATADAPRVATDIAPVHSLVARVMDGVGTPDLVVPPGVSPHGHAMRPSEAVALQNADAVFWVGPSFTPWLQDAVDTLAGDAESVVLLEADGLHHRDGEGHDHGHEHGAEDHDHGADDPHAWLDPENAVVWLDAITAKMTQIDPENAESYAANARAGRAEIEAAAEEVATRLAPFHGAGYVVFHDAYAHFEARFDMPSRGAISLGDATTPSAARVGALRDRVAAGEVSCVFAEPQLNDGLVATLVEGTGARRGVLDPLGIGLEAGPALYPALIRGMAESLATCLGES